MLPFGKMVKRLLFSLLAGISMMSASADVITDAQELIEAGEYAAAAQLLRADMGSLKAARIGAANQLLGECLYELGDYQEARSCFDKAKAKGVADASLYLGRLDFLDYDFENAGANYNRYRELMRKSRKEVSEDIEAEEERLNLAEGFLERVEKIAIIDSLNLPKDDFFKSYRLPASAGSLRDASVLPFKELRDLPGAVFVNEGQDRMFWSQPDADGLQRLMETQLLTDGTWHSPMPIDSLAAGSDAAWPFMMGDGVTLYFASDGEESLGGYDIFVANRDAATGKFMQPQNMGMPYNSPADDYMLALDELNNVGWWATDRNSPEGYVTVYAFVPNDLRRNYDPETDDVASFARIDDYKATWDGNDYTQLLSEIASIDPSATPKKADFHLPMPGLREYTSYSDFKSAEARALAKRYFSEQKQLEDAEQELRKMRQQYHVGKNPTLGNKIRTAESNIEHRRADLKKMRSDLYKAETAGR